MNTTPRICKLIRITIMENIIDDPMEIAPEYDYCELAGYDLIEMYDDFNSSIQIEEYEEYVETYEEFDNSTQIEEYEENYDECDYN